MLDLLKIQLERRGCMQRTLSEVIGGRGLLLWNHCSISSISRISFWAYLVFSLTYSITSFLHINLSRPWLLFSINVRMVLFFAFFPTAPHISYILLTNNVLITKKKRQVPLQLISIPFHLVELSYIHYISKLLPPVNPRKFWYRIQTAIDNKRACPILIRIPQHAPSMHSKNSYFYFSFRHLSPLRIFAVKPTSTNNHQLT